MDDTTTITHIPLDRLARGIYQPRRQFDENLLHELADSIKSLGMIQPITVRPLTNGNYEIVAGERRWRAAQLAGLSDVPCIIRHYSDEEAAQAATIENLQREDLNPIEEARAYQRLIHEFDYTHEQIATSLGKSRTKVSNSLRLLNLDSRVQQWLINKKLSEGHGKILISLPIAWQIKLGEKCIQHDWSVRKLEMEIKKIQDKPLVEKADPNLLRLEQNLASELAAEVKFETENAGSGWIKIRYYDLETLEGLFQKFGVKLN